MFAFRTLSVASRVFFLPLLEELTHEPLRMRGVALGGPLMWCAWTSCLPQWPSG